MSLIWFLITGLIAGWLAGLLMRGHGFGVFGDLVLGVIGALIGGHVLRWFGIITYGLIGSLIAAVVGATILVAAIRLVKTA